MTILFRKKSLILLLQVVLAGVVVYLFSQRDGVTFASTSQREGVSSSSCRVEPRSGVSLCWNTDEAIFPEAKLYSMSATPLLLSERDRSLRWVEKAMQPYPPLLLNQNLKVVFLVESLYFRGIRAGGTYGSDRLYIANRGKKQGYTDQFIERTFHHELSSVLLWRHPKLLNNSAWKAINSPSFHYQGGGTEAVKSGGSSVQLREEWWVQGFLNQYSTASLEEDFNELTEYLLTHSPSARPALAGSPQLQRKAALVEGFYRSLGMNINSSVQVAKPLK